MEDVNPARRYKWFRPRQAARIYVQTPSTPTNFGTVSLYNSTRGSQYLIVRDIQLTTDKTVEAVGISYAQGKVGAFQNTNVPLIPGQASLPGDGYYLDAAAAFVDDYFLLANTPPGWNHDFPIAVLPPNWSLCLQVDGTGDGVYIAFLFEAIEADQLDFLYQDL